MNENEVTVAQMLSGRQFQVLLEILYQEQHKFEAQCRRLGIDKWNVMIHTIDENLDYFVDLLDSIMNMSHAH